MYLDPSRLQWCSELYVELNKKKKKKAHVTAQFSLKFMDDDEKQRHFL